MSIFSSIGDLFSGVGGAVDSLVTSDEERLKLRNELTKLESALVMKFIELEKAKYDLQASLAESSNKLAAVEATSDSAFTRNYRPAIICGMFVMITLDYIGLTSRDLPVVFLQIFGATFGLMIPSRSAEKIVKSVISKKVKPDQEEPK